ncbi:MAG: hypothetical protein ACRDL0_00340 [Thermoleophilaceae bacterium]
MRLLCAIALLAAALLGACANAETSEARRPPLNKAIWGPAQIDGESQFPIYRRLGARIWQTHIAWNEVAPTRPRRPRRPADPAYRWPAELDYAVREAARHRIRVAVQVLYSPPWANGGRSREWAPRPRHFARFLRAAARRYPKVRHWMIWGEPTRAANFRPLPRFQATGPRRYARILDAAYRALKRANRRNLVIGGNTFTTGDVSPRQFIKSMRLRNGRRPRMDLYGHNPFTRRSPNLRRRPLGYGFADFSDLDTLARWLDRYFGRRRGRPLRIFVSEFTIPTDHRNYAFNFYKSRRVQARWLRRALRISRRYKRIHTFGWYQLYDQPPNSEGTEVNWGLIDHQGRRKPAFRAFRKG